MATALQVLGLLLRSQYQQNQCVFKSQKRLSEETIVADDHHIISKIDYFQAKLCSFIFHHELTHIEMFYGGPKCHAR